jgi:hypothetical protein
MIARLECRVSRFDHFADRAAFQRLADLERLNVAPTAGLHPPAHVRVYGHPQIADEDLPFLRRRHRHLNQFEMLRRGHPRRAGFQTNLTAGPVRHGYPPI